MPLVILNLSLHLVQIKVPSLISFFNFDLVNNLKLERQVGLTIYSRIDDYMICTTNTVL